MRRSIGEKIRRASPEMIPASDLNDRKNRIPIRMKNNRRWTFPLNAARWMSASFTGIALPAGCAAEKQPEAKAQTGWVKKSGRGRLDLRLSAGRNRYRAGARERVPAGRRNGLAQRRYARFHRVARRLRRSG